MGLRIRHYSDIENATDDPQRIGRLTTCLRERLDDATLVCGTGDTIGPGLLAMETAGEHVLPFIDAAKPDYSTGHIRGPIRIQRNWRKNVRTSSRNSSGTSIAAKWPPSGISVQWTMS